MVVLFVGVVLFFGIVVYKGTKTENIKIGYHLVSLKHPFAASLAEEFEKEARRNAITPIVTSANNDRFQELKNIDYFIQEKVDAIFITAMDPDFIHAALERAKREGIPVFAIDRSIDHDAVITQITSDNEDIGEQAAYYLVDQFTKKNGVPVGKVIEIKGNMNVSATIDRSKGFRDVMKNYPDIEIVGEAYGDFDPYKSRQETYQLLKKNPHIDGIFAHNDDIILGAYTAWNDLQLTDRPLMIGADGIPQVINLIDEGKIDATLVQQANKIMKTAFQAYDHYQKGKSIPDEIKVKARIYKNHALSG